MTKLSAYILLDRSGSMNGAKWETAIGSINDYVLTLKKEKVDAEVTVAAFDSMMESTPVENVRGTMWNNIIPAYSKTSTETKFDVLRDKKNAKTFRKLDADELNPRGGTPLFDATAKLLNMADKNNNEKTVILIMTDGEENTSQIYNIKSIKDRIATCTNRGWEVIFLGAEFNATRQAFDYGLGAGKVMNSSVATMNSSMRSYGTMSAEYAKSGTAIDTTKVS